MEEFLFASAKSLTHPGRKRPNNEDFVDFCEPTDPQDSLESGSLYIVADGVGGAAFGEKASKYAVQKVLHDYYLPSPLTPAKRLEAAMLTANRDIYNYSRSDAVSAQMATTIVAALVFRNQLIVANVGDSPAYLIRAGQIRQLSRSHSLVDERIRDGTMTEEEARNSHIKNRLTRSLGGEAEVIVDVTQPVSLIAGDRIVLCSDGLTRYATRQQILWLAGSGTQDEAVSRMVDYANQKGGADNITVLVALIEVPDFAQPVVSASSTKKTAYADLADIETYTPGNEPRKSPPASEQTATSKNDPAPAGLSGLTLKQKLLVVGSVLAVLAALAIIVVAIWSNFGGGNNNQEPTTKPTSPSTPASEPTVTPTVTTPTSTLTSTLTPESNSIPRDYSLSKSGGPWDGDKVVKKSEAHWEFP